MSKCFLFAFFSIKFRDYLRRKLRFVDIRMPLSGGIVVSMFFKVETKIPVPNGFISKEISQFWMVYQLIIFQVFLEENYKKRPNTFSNGCLGSHTDEERSEMRYVMRIAKASESSKFWTQLALPWKYACWSVCSLPTLPEKGDMSATWLFHKVERAWRWKSKQIYFGESTKCFCSQTQLIRRLLINNVSSKNCAREKKTMKDNPSRNIIRSDLQSDKITRWI